LRQTVVSAAGAVEKNDAKMIFELSQSDADCRLSAAYAVGSFLNAAFFDHGDEHFELHKFHGYRSLEFATAKNEKGRYLLLDNGLWASSLEIVSGRRYPLLRGSIIRTDTTTRRLARIERNAKSLEDVRTCSEKSVRPAASGMEATARRFVS